MSGCLGVVSAFVNPRPSSGVTPRTRHSPSAGERALHAFGAEYRRAAWGWTVSLQRDVLDASRTLAQVGVVGERHADHPALARRPRRREFVDRDEAVRLCVGERPQ